MNGPNNYDVLATIKLGRAYSALMDIVNAAKESETKTITLDCILDIIEKRGANKDGID